MIDPFESSDDFGPYKTIHINRPRDGLKAIVVVDNVACGPAIGGVRMAEDVSLDECLRLARAMTLKNASAGLPHGGAKSVIFANPRISSEEKEKLIRAFACAISDISDYIAGPDMGTDEEAMAWVKDEIGRCVGLPKEIGGIPLDEIGITGFGCAIAADVAAQNGGFALEGARVAVQGFGAVGKNAARFLQDRGCVLVAASDSKGTLIDMAGLELDMLLELKESGKSVIDAPSGEKFSCDAIISVECEIWIPAARPDVLDAENASNLTARCVIEGANIPATDEAEEILHQRGVVVVPDFIANAGGVICAAVEYRGGTQTEAYQEVEEKVRRNTHAVLERASENNLPPRTAANAYAKSIVSKSMSLRRWA